jgi:hypothetical protein
LVCWSSCLWSGTGETSSLAGNGFDEEGRKETAHLHTKTMLCIGGKGGRGGRGEEARKGRGCKDQKRKTETALPNSLARLAQLPYSSRNALAGLLDYWTTGTRCSRGMGFCGVVPRNSHYCEARMVQRSR